MKKHEVNIYPAITGENLIALKESMAKGFDSTFPIVLYEDQILDGWNRYLICQEFGIDPVYKTFEGTTLEAIQFVDASNSRRDLNTFQRCEIALSREKTFRDMAKAQQIRKPNSVLQNSVKQIPINTQKETAKYAKTSHDTYAKAKTIIEKATPEQLEKVNSGDLTINKAYNNIRREEKKEAYKQKVEKIQKKEIILTDLPNLILCDPPWQYNFAETSNRKIENQYDTLLVNDMANHLPKIQEDCILFMWATSPKLREAFELFDLWSFEYKTHAIWNKEIIGSGYWFRGQHELLLVGTKGKVSPPLESFRKSSIFTERRTDHSKKPVCIYEWIEEAFGDKIKIEMYARTTREGWHSHGNEIE